MKRFMGQFSNHVWMVLVAGLVAGCAGEGEEARQAFAQSSDPGGEQPAGEVLPQDEATPTVDTVPTPAPGPGDEEPEERGAPVVMERDDDPVAPEPDAPRQEQGFGSSDQESVDPDVLQRTDQDDPLEDEPVVDPIPDEPPAPEVPLGTQLTLVSDIELDTESTVAGDPVMATVTDDLIASDGMVLIPEGARLLGRVVRSESSSGPDSDPVLEIEFETLSTQDAEWSIHATVIQMDVESERKDSDARTAAKIGGAAAAGAILGKILGGDGEDAAKGGVAGAVAGTVLAMETRAGEAVLPVGAVIVVEFQRTLVMP